MPQGGFGNLIALPLQKRARDQGNSVFLDDDLRSMARSVGVPCECDDGSAERRSKPLAQDAERRGRILGVRLPPDDDDAEPWTARPSRRATNQRYLASCPTSLELVLGNQIYIAKEGLSPRLRNRLLRLAAFQNPEFYKAQAMRLSTYDKPRVIACAEDHSHHIALPRGCLDDVEQTLKTLGIRPIIRDERTQGAQIDLTFHGELRPEQKVAADALAEHDIGVLAATTAFGKTVVAAELIARRGVNTLVLVHRRQLLDQWIERLSTFLGLLAKIHRTHRWWTERADRHCRRGHHSEPGQEGRGRRPCRAGTAISSSMSATISLRIASSRWLAKPRRGSSSGCRRPSRARTVIIRSSSCSAVRFGIA